MKKTVLLSLMLMAATPMFSQTKKAPAPTTPTISHCHLPADSASSNALSLDDIKAWADSKPLQVRCTGGKLYTLTQFTISVIKQNPMQTLDFGSETMEFR